MVGQYYRAVEIGSPEPVNYVGVHPLLWHDHPEQPDLAFTEEEVYPKEIVEVLWRFAEEYFSDIENVQEEFENWKTERDNGD
jgi:hypothetical protein